MNTERIKAVMDTFVDGKHIPGYNCLINRQGKELAYLQSGLMHIETGKAIERDTIFRIYSMTKPVTSVAMMQLFEQGKFKMDDPVHRYIPAWKDLQVFKDGDADSYSVVSPDRPMRVLDLFTHTSGLTYDFMQSHPVDALYRRHGITGNTFDVSARTKAEILAGLPLQFSPGTQWNYSVSTDALGYLVELLSDQPLDDYIRENITQPLGMRDTDFQISATQHDRLAACYQADPANGQMILIDDPATSRFQKRPGFISGGGGLVSTIDDYFRFCEVMMHGGETADSPRILQRKTVDLMTRNHLPGNSDLTRMGETAFSETSYEGIGFGLGFSVVVDNARTETASNVGEYAWGGLASTCFWIDPVEQMVVIFMTQLIPSNAYPIRTQLRTAVYDMLAGN